MSEKMEMERYEEVAPAPIANDFLLQVAAQAEARVAAVLKIKRVALAVTNYHDWCDQDGKPYMMTSAAEKIANLFNISWRIDEPKYVEDPDGHYTYHYRGEFSLSGRTIEVEGSRSSKDGFFRQYDGYGENRKEKTVAERNNKRDVQMSAYTNLLGNGISRLLGLRNLTYDDLLEFAQIKREDIGKVEYKKSNAKPAVSQPKSKSEAVSGEVSTTSGLVENVTYKTGGEGKKAWTKYAVTILGESYSTFDKTIAENAKAAKEMACPVVVEYTTDKYGHNIVSLTAMAESEEREPGSDDE